eukprot:scaffold5.g922.t1
MAAPDEAKQKAIEEYKRKLLQHKELDSKVRGLREEVKTQKKEYDKTEDDLKALQSVGQIIGEVLRQLDEERFIVKSSSGPRYVVGCRSKVDKAKLTPNTRVALDVTTLTIMRILPREVDPVVFNMTQASWLNRRLDSFEQMPGQRERRERAESLSGNELAPAAGPLPGACYQEDPGKVDYSNIGGLSEQIRELREAVELPLINPELFARVGIKPPTGVLLYGPPGTGKTLLAKAIASNIDANFLKVVASGVVDKYIGESARVIREMFGYARDHQPCIIFMDEIDAIGGRRYSEGTSADREVQRTLMELLAQLDGFEQLGKVKLVAATNRPDVLDPALMRPGRLDRKIQIPLPNEQARMEILKIHASKITKHGDIDYEAVVKLGEGFNGADLRNVCTEAGMFAIRDERDYCTQARRGGSGAGRPALRTPGRLTVGVAWAGSTRGEDFMKAVRKLAEAKKLENTQSFSSDWGGDKS